MLKFNVIWARPLLPEMQTHDHFCSHDDDDDGDDDDDDDVVDEAWAVGPSSLQSPIRVWYSAYQATCQA